MRDGRLVQIMAFIRTKEIKGRLYYYLVKSFREDGKVKQKVIKYLGTTPMTELEKSMICKKAEKKIVKEEKDK